MYFDVAEAREDYYSERIAQAETECLCHEQSADPRDPAFEECHRCRNKSQCLECQMWTLNVEIKDEVCPDCWVGTTSMAGAAE